MEALPGNESELLMKTLDFLKELQGKMRQIELINELSNVINSSLSIGTVFRLMVSEIRKLISYDRASLLLFNEKEDNLLIFALDTDMKTIMTRGVKAPIEGTSAGWVIRNNRPWINYDLAADIRFPLDRKLYREGIRSTISIPLFQDKLLGVFNLDSTVRAQYSEKDLLVLLPVARQISIALENALLFEEVLKGKREWERTFDAITDMLWIGDGKGRVLRANRTLLTTTGIASVEILGKRCTELFGRIGITVDDCPGLDSLSTRQPSYSELKGAGGSLYNFWAYPLVDEDGHLYAMVYYLKDVTAQKRLEQQLVRADKLASLGTLVAGIAHEINNPLGIIAGYSEALIERARDKALLGRGEFEDFPEYLQTIHNEIFRCKGILRSLLDFARPSGGTCREIDINELIKEVILLVNHRAKRLKHTIELQLNRDLPKIHAEPGALRQLFMNIIINSLYFTPEKGSIIIKSESEEGTGDRRIGLPAEGVLVSIRDTGTGIRPDIIGKVFDPFFTTKPVGEGTGLGLSICHKIVEEHGGSIDVQSEAGGGTTFFIWLPAKGNHD
jgi:two-component system NtrC family sensor kinase